MLIGGIASSGSSPLRYLLLSRWCIQLGRCFGATHPISLINEIHLKKDRRKVYLAPEPSSAGSTSILPFCANWWGRYSLMDSRRLPSLFSNSPSRLTSFVDQHLGKFYDSRLLDKSICEPPLRMNPLMNPTYLLTNMIFFTDRLSSHKLVL